MPLHPEVAEATAAVLEAIDQPDDFKRRLMALVRNIAEDGVEDGDVTAVVAAIDTSTDTGR